MNNEKLKLFGIPLVGALVIYFVGYFTVEHLRHRKGPWQVRFFATNNRPAIRVDQPFLEISNIVILFDGETLPTNFTATNITFVEPRDIPFKTPYGRTIFEDLTFLPGTVTFDFNGHGVELIPRTLNLNGKEHPWRSGEIITLRPDEKSHPITPEEYKERMKVLKDKS